MASTLKQFSNKTRLMSKNFIQEGIEVPRRVKVALFDGSLDVINTAKKSMRNTKKGTNFVKRGKKRHFMSKPGNPPAIDGGRGVASVRFDLKTWQTEIGSDLEYMALHEKRKKVKFRRPWLQPAVRQNRSNIIKNIGKIVPDITTNFMVRSGAKRI